ncbi:MAG: 50S ribosomal protein L6 [Candidatus Omnitrophica bacterium]|nr:50S ribosomal protein L6 [Candidatus Omnitrophota bacterium]
MSRIGRKPVAIPSGVKVEIKEGTIFVEGPKGKLSRVLPGRTNVEIKNNIANVTRQGNIASDKALQGLIRALLVNMVKGVTEGYVKELEIVGVGFKAAVQGNNLKLEVGYSHPVNFTAPEGIKIETPKATQVVIRGIDKEKVGEVAAEIRLVYPPEPYKGKGIRYVGEFVKKKVGKAQATTK